MNTVHFQANLSATKEFLFRLISKNVTTDANTWLQSVTDETQTERRKYLAFSMAPRHTGKSQLTLSEAELTEAKNIRKNWRPELWSAEQATRVLILLSFFNGDFGAFKKTLDTLFLSADVGELVALYSSLPLLPNPTEFAARASEGVRTNMTSVFDAVVLNNPYPSEYLSEQAWNQMVLKAIFVGRPLYKIIGLDERRNPELARMVSDFAHERWAAGRTVTPEAWRLVAPFLQTNESLQNDLKKVENDSNHLQQKAAALVLREAGISSTRIEDTRSWQTLADEWYSK
ncbi:MAG: EboA domain-containing protein [Ignavibacteriae bacterium]|nr:EboA domain-containing protein [Ignavibacteriota bacterium]